MTDSTDIVLQADRVCKNYPDGNVDALVEVDLQIRRGEYIAVMGPSGSGKSTLLSMLGLLDRPTTGQVLIDGKTVTSQRAIDRVRATKIGFIFQSFHLLPTLSALENVQIPMFGVIQSAALRRQKATDLLALVGMSDRAKHRPDQLSVGQRQRVAIARSLANEPALLLADEPTGNLDSKTADEILDLFDSLHQQRQMSLVVITHSESVARRADRTIHLFDGAIADQAHNSAATLA